MLRAMGHTGLLEPGCLEDRNMSFMPADFAAAEREAGCGVARGADVAGLAGPGGSGAASDAGAAPGAAEAPEEGAVCALAAAGCCVCMSRFNAPSLHNPLSVSPQQKGCRRLAHTVSTYTCLRRVLQSVQCKKLASHISIYLQVQQLPMHWLLPYRSTP